MTSPPAPPVVETLADLERNTLAPFETKAKFFERADEITIAKFARFGVRAAWLVKSFNEGPGNAEAALDYMMCLLRESRAIAQAEGT